MKNLIYLFFLSPFLTLAQDSTSTGNRRAWYHTTQQTSIDSSSVVKVNNQVYFQFHTGEDADTSIHFGLYRNDVNPKDFFITYLVNTTDSTIRIKRQDRSLIMIREAIDQKGNWTPIEYWVYSGCGNSYHNPLELKSGNCVAIPTRKYSGDFKTQVRLKFRNGDHLTYSDPYEASINKSMFKQETKEVHGILYRGAPNYLND